MKRRFKGPAAILVVTGLAATLGVWHHSTGSPPIPRRALRIGFESNPPAQIRTANGFEGLAVETVNEAARRAGLTLQWVETGTSSDEAFEKGLVDLWPVMADLPHRRKRVHFSRPWLHSGHALLLRPDAEAPQRGFEGRIAYFRMPVHQRLLREQFPKAQFVDLDRADALRAVCSGAVAATFFEWRAGLAALREKPSECGSMELRVQNLPATTVQLAVASTFESAGAADKIRDKITDLYRDGSLSMTMAKYSFYGLNDAWATYNLMDAAERQRWMEWSIAGLMLALASALWQAFSLRRARQAAERANATTSQALSRYELVSRATNDALLECDLRSGLVIWNEAVHVLFRYAPDQVGASMSWWEERIHADDRERVSAGMRAAIARRAPTWSDEYRFLRGDGSYASVVDRGYLVYDSVRPVRLIRAIMDVTAHRSLEEQFRQAQKMEAVGRLAGGVAHDFNNLLTVIAVYSELALKSLSPANPLHELLTEIQNVGEKGAALTQQLLSFSRKQFRQVTVLDLNAVIGGAAKILRRVIGEDIELELNLDPALGPVRADEAQIHQVLMNLAVNARDAMPAGGKLTLSSANLKIQDAETPQPRGIPPGRYALMTITDTGSGMDAQAQAHLFEPFFTTKEAGKGTGLGLSTVYGIVRQSNGFITVSSAEGKGTSIRILLPRVEAGVSAAEPAIAYAGDFRGNETVLLVEDQENVRTCAAAILKELGYQVLQAGNANAALSLSESHDGRIQILLTDVLMPGMNGCALADRIRSARPGISVIYMSGYSEAMLPPGAAFLRKPFNPATLAALLRKAVQRPRAAHSSGG